MQILCKYCANIVQILCKYYANMAASHKFQTLAACCNEVQKAPHFGDVAAQGEFVLAEPAALVQLDGQAETAARTEGTF